MMLPVKPGDVILGEFPVPGGQIKRRPSIILKIVPPYDDLLCCGISRQLGRMVPDLDELILFSDSDFDASGLPHESLVRVGYITTIFIDDVDGIMGAISTERLRRLLDRLAFYLQK